MRKIIQYLVSSSISFAIRSLFCCVALIGVLVGPVSNVSAAPPAWQQYGQNPQHTSRSPYHGPRISTIFSSFVFNQLVSDQWGPLLVDSQNAVYAMVRSNGAGNDFTINRIIADGTLVWTSNVLCCGQAPVIDTNDTFFFFNTSINTFQARHPDGTTSSLASIPVGGYGGQFAAIDAQNTLYETYTSYGWLGGMSAIDVSGNLRWQQYGMFGPGIAAISPDNQTIYVKDHLRFSDEPSMLWAVNASTGSVKWSTYTGGDSPPVVTPLGNIIFIQYGSILAITPSGQFLWQKLYGSPWTSAFMTNLMLTAAGNLAFVLHTSLENRLIVLDQLDGSERASFPLPYAIGVTGAVIDADDVIYFGLNELGDISAPVGTATLTAFSLQIGAMLWQRTFPNAVMQHHMAIDANGRLLVMVADYGQGKFFLHRIGEKQIITSDQLGVMLLGQKFCVTQEYLNFDKQNKTYDHLHAGIDFGSLREDCTKASKVIEQIKNHPVTNLAKGRVIRTDVDKNGKVDKHSFGGVYVYVPDPTNPANPNLGFTVIYLHLAEIFVNLDQNLVGGEIIGTVGNTHVENGNGPHLHIEVRRGLHPNATGCGQDGCSSFNGSFATKDITINPVFFFSR